MTRFHQIALSFAALAAYIVVSELIPGGGFLDLVAIGLGVILAVIFGPRLHFCARLFITGVLFDFGYEMCLVGRTSEPGLNGYTAGLALFYFGLFVPMPLCVLLRLWQPRVAVTLAMVSLPICLGLALLAAGTEEYLFVQRYHVTGAGTTKRWTVSNHWLSYDAERQQLHGSD